MPLSIFDLPHDGNGAIVGRWRVRHRDPLSTHFAGREFVEGESVHPVDGMRLRHLAAAIGPDISAEPWDAEAAREIREQAFEGWQDPAGLLRGAEGGHPEAPQGPQEPDEAEPPEGTAETAPEPESGPQAAEEPPSEEDGEDAAEPDELEGLAKHELMDLADGLDIKLDGRWSEERMRETIRDRMQ